MTKDERILELEQAAMQLFDMVHESENTQNKIKANDLYDTIKGQSLPIGSVGDCDSIKTTWDIRECFKQLRFDKKHHLGLGDIRLTIAQQDEICDLVERFYHCR